MISKSRAIELVGSYQVYNHNGNCPLCGHAQSRPYRKRDLQGRVFAGCISVHHKIQDHWECRPVAKAFRRAQAETLLERWSEQDLCQLDEIGNEAYSNLIR